MTQSGSGQGAIINHGVSFNYVDNPVPKGRVITMFGTGAGRWNLAFPDGSIYIGGPGRAESLANKHLQRDSGKAQAAPVPPWPVA